MSGKKDPTSDLPDPSSSSSTEFPTQAEAEADALLAKEMNQLSVEEREKVLEDVHGIARVIDEPQEFIEACLALLEKELTNISSRAAYDLASSMSKEYTSSNKMRLMFLRAESFDPNKAASHMVAFFDEKYKLFGAEKLTKDIVLADLDPDDIVALESGSFQVLPEKDSAGRKVFCTFPHVSAGWTTQNKLRALYYILMSNLEDDDEAQQRGVVGCAYVVGCDFQFDFQFGQKQTKLRKALPVRIRSVHLCYSDLRLVPVFSLAMFFMGSHTRMRFRAHYGSSHEECQCQLSSFGIPMSAFPMSLRGELNLENHRTYMAMQRRAIEVKQSVGDGPLGVAQKPKEKPEGKALSRQPMNDVLFAAPQPNTNEPMEYGGGLMDFSNNFGFLPLPSFTNPWYSVVGAPTLPSVVPPHKPLPVYPASHITGPTSASLPPAKFSKSPANPHVIDDPLPNDILLGRGKPIQYRPANVRFRKMLDSHMDKYGKGEKGDNVFVPAYIVYIVKEEGGRFLKELQDGGWVEVDEATAQAKVSQAFRSRRQVFQATLKKDTSAA